MESRIFNRILALVAERGYQFSRHVLKAAADDNILLRDLISGVAFGEVVEDYPDYYAGPCCLVLQSDASGNPIHVLWGIKKDSDGPAIGITCYKPDPSRWETGFRRRRP